MDWVSKKTDVTFGVDLAWICAIQQNIPNILIVLTSFKYFPVENFPSNDATSFKSGKSLVTKAKIV